MRPAKYPWRSIDVGQSFFAPGRTSNSVQGDARKYHAPKKFNCREVSVKGVAGVKVTRIA